MERLFLLDQMDNTARLWKRFQWDERTKALFMKYYSLLKDSEVLRLGQAITEDKVLKGHSSNESQQDEA